MYLCELMLNYAVRKDSRQTSNLQLSTPQLKIVNFLSLVPVLCILKYDLRSGNRLRFSYLIT